MSFSRVEDALEDAFVEWINTFDGRSSSIDTIVELADGTVLSEILIDIDSKWFKQLSHATRQEESGTDQNNIRTSSSSNNSSWVVRLNNQKRAHKLITRYFDEVLGQDPELLPVVDLNAIAKEAKHHELLRMCQLVIAIAVQSDNNHVYIDMIQGLSPKSQHALMLSIEEVMSNFNSDASVSRSSQVSSTSTTSTSRSFDSDMPYRYQIEFDKLIAEKKYAEATHTQLLIEYDHLRDKFDGLLLEKREIEARLRDMDEQFAHTSSSSKTDFTMRTEIEQLRQDLERCEEQRIEAEHIIEAQLTSIQHLKRRVTELTAKAEEVDSLRTELEEYRAALQHIGSLEATLERYEREAQDRGELEDQIEALELQNTDLLKRSHQLEDEYRKVLRFKTVMGSFEEQVQQLATSNRELIEEKNQLEEELRKMSETCAYLEQDRDRNVEQVEILEEQIREIELGGGTSMEKAINTRPSTEIEEGIESDSNIEENLKKANITELRLTIQRFKKQIKEMEHKPTAALLETKQLEKNYASVVEERDQLRNELAQIRNGIPDSLLNQTQTIMSFRSRILDLEREAKLLKESTIKLDAAVAHGTRSVVKDHVTLEKFEKEHSRVQDRLNRLEDITKMQLHDINRMLVEANYLHGINSDGALKDRPVLTDGDLELIKEQNANLQICVLHLQESINDSQGKIRKVRDIIKLYTQLLQEMTVRFNASRRPTESGLLNRTPRTKEEEYDLLKKQIHNVRVQSKNEQQLIISGWYDLARRNHHEPANVSLQSTPSSWLGRQRKILDSQLRKRLC